MTDWMGADENTAGSKAWTAGEAAANPARAATAKREAIGGLTLVKM